VTETASIGRFLSELEHELRGNPRWRAEIVAEIHAHLLDALDRAGDDPEAAKRIVDRFGDPVDIAHQLNRVDRRLRLHPAALRLGGTAASAIAAVTLLAVNGNERESGRDPNLPPSTTQLIGSVVAVGPASTTIRVRPASTATELSRAGDATPS
jgi:hypothetical protein